MKYQSKNSQKQQKLKSEEDKRFSLEALAVDNAWSSFVVFFVSDNHLWEGSKGSKDGTTDPNSVFTLWWGDNLDLHCGWSEGSDFLLHTFGNTFEHGGTSGENDVGIEILTDIDIAVHDGVVGGTIDTIGFDTVHGWLEE